MPQDYYPSGPFLRQLPDRGEFDVAREDFLLGFAVRTARAYKADLEHFREWCAGQGVDPVEASNRERDQYVASLELEGYATGTIRRRAAVVSGFLGHVGDRGAALGETGSEH